ncbi:hypothetical protein AK812_SmicGene42336 [Symbiodinium microadriaticum]|uniref:Core-binding (CB) domain-containing protein n=1 Tax=Symbiodinium microadriaticum TaxID=2951 RepID=A0A1Q9C3U0_SYMMI|nr:hypothetical protein AK812_SmicGene42336 [Symbiodinium microadriaticum]
MSARPAEADLKKHHALLGMLRFVAHFVPCSVSVLFLPDARTVKRVDTVRVFRFDTHRVQLELTTIVRQEQLLLRQRAQAAGELEELRSHHFLLRIMSRTGMGVALVPRQVGCEAEWYDRVREMTERLRAHSPAAAVNEPRPPVPALDIASQAFGAFQDVHPSLERDQLMDKAVCKLQLIVSRFNKSRLSSELRNALEAASPQAQLQETIAACVGLRSPHTVLKRANAILAFLRWADKEDTLEPLSEGSVWDFFSWLKREGAPPSRAASLMSAFRFINFVLGVSLQDLLSSRRLCGLSIQLGVQKTSASRARPLTVNEVKYLHKVLEDSTATNWDRAIAGYLLLALYARARHSDFFQIEEVIPDFDAEGGGYLEVRLRIHKTAQTLAKRNDLLPVIVTARSIKE